jgi:zinc/manganese transport system permease protein
MDTGLLFDPLFRLPFFTGLLVAAVLPLLGVLLMLREEWLAALGLAHLAAAGALVGLAAGVPAVAGAALGAALGGGVKALTQARGNAAYGFMILIGWSAMMLAAANTPVGDALGHALVDGQLYFAGVTELAASLILTALAGLAYPGSDPGWCVPGSSRGTTAPIACRPGAGTWASISWPPWGWPWAPPPWA